MEWDETRDSNLHNSTLPDVPRDRDFQVHFNHCLFQFGLRMKLGWILFQDF